MGRKREETMGERLKRIREERGFSQTELAAAAGIPVGSLRSWERNRREPLLGSAAKLADALGCTLDELAGRSGPKHPRKGKGE
jgi:transcriptional regulator with XRE-family HTH domain